MDEPKFRQGEKFKIEISRIRRGSKTGRYASADVADDHIKFKTFVCGIDSLRAFPDEAGAEPTKN